MLKNVLIVASLLLTSSALTASPPRSAAPPSGSLDRLSTALLAVTSSMSFAQGPPPTSTNCKNCLDTSKFPDLALKILTYNDDSGNSLSCAVSAAITKVSFANDDCTVRTTGCSEASCTFGGYWVSSGPLPELRVLLAA